MNQFIENERIILEKFVGARVEKLLLGEMTNASAIAFLTEAFLETDYAMLDRFQEAFYGESPHVKPAMAFRRFDQDGYAAGFISENRILRFLGAAEPVMTAAEKEKLVVEQVCDYPYMLLSRYYACVNIGGPEKDTAPLFASREQSVAAGHRAFEQWRDVSIPRPARATALADFIVSHTLWLLEQFCLWAAA